MADETKSTSTKTETKPAAAPAATTSSTTSVADKSDKTKKVVDRQNGKGDGPRNCFSPKFRSNFDAIDWSK